MSVTASAAPPAVPPGTPAQQVTGSRALLDVLVDEGVRYVFGNPGTTELPLLAELASAGIEFVHTLHEAAAVGMADGYARVTGRPAFVNLHSTAGLGNGLGVLTNSAAAGIPLVVTAGQQDYRHIWQAPLLSGDLTGLASSLVKWSHEARSREELAVMARRAFQLAGAHPSGPVFLALPVNFLDEPGPPAPARSRVGAAATGDVGALARSVLDTPPGRLALVYGDDVTNSGAGQEGVLLAEALGAPVFGPSWPGSNPFPTTHRLWRGFLSADADGFAAHLGPFDRVLVVGGRALTGYVRTPAPLLPAHLAVLQIAPDPAALGRQAALEAGVVGDLPPTLRALRAAVEGRVPQPPALPAEPARERAAEPPDPGAELTHESVARCVSRALPSGALVVEEALSTRPALWRTLRLDTVGQYLAPANAGLGWAMPAACGAALGAPGTPVLCVVGDGAALYTPQALWNAARQHLPVTFLVVNNARYQVLDTNWHRMRPDQAAPPPVPGLDLAPPAIGFTPLALSLGIEATVARTRGELDDQLRAAFDSGLPRLVEAVLTPEPGHTPPPRRGD
ncbi:thiamine pyrophosphate-binding protein [Kitasatospora sp. NPDC004272]